MYILVISLKTGGIPDMKSILIKWNRWKIRRCLNAIQLPSDKVMFSYRLVDGKTMYPTLKVSLDALSVVPNGVVFYIARLIELSVKKFAPGSDFLNMDNRCVNVRGTIDQKKKTLEVYIDGYTRFLIDL